ncbi:50S ribosomal protein L17 [Ehrlichia ruminantium]|uniref:Large ribosomal subunit protein bL17 n=3 Tax=Ehrlichia ruminantium TaxID=779 RepID=RL17_EHRRG|nr:50S ribosomal protein L17 [Ehrlichia ruminantium]Q5FFS2.1 RecName: Full=Large ribosomal subunit protein bL17; AltName: Full=50S ribosomal protein L17 [Ehrlichia ruminantium str. Gardel]Q5HAU6.1 RecName: Full=Large ribosomal subunit protein bL17; AltName: Full=50S ribosomal protein L17 [Ehrlichia ruminantium str. Welgevonden]KYW91399.1 50S ribosomal protein L17 [Ehrlichia ruminantium]QLK50663.1 50S ribosomal protein L17 [Ehrlichia ruminantium]QLK51588.1 50S ribosomal protein L17 [Ehrlichia r
MRHRVAHRKFSRTSAHRISMLLNLSISLIKHERITTTLPKAKELRPYVEKLITIGKVYREKNLVYGKRLLISKLKNIDATDKLIDVLSVRYKSRNGGYTRIMKNGFRKGDCAPIAIIELVDRQIVSQS